MIFRILQSHYNHQEVPSAAWIGLRANGTASQVAWTWSSGRPLGSETFSKREVEDFNELAVRENKLCVMAKKEYGQVYNLTLNSLVFWDSLKPFNLKGVILNINV